MTRLKIMKPAASHTVNFAKKPTAPRAPNTVEPLPPPMTPMPPLFPGWRRTTKISRTQTRT